MSNIEYHYQTIGRILVFLVDKGLARVDLRPEDVMDIMTERRGSEEDVLSTFSDCIDWMHDERLIRIGSTHMSMGGGFIFIGVQLTSTGIAIIKSETDDEKIGGSIEERVAQDGPKNLDTSVYTRIGEFVGGTLGGFTKSMAGG